jgi:hypothetical protein
MKEENPCANQDCQTCPHKQECDEEEEEWDEDLDDEEEE